MDEKIISRICEITGHKYRQVQNTLKLISEGATIPFISRYRKEMTDSLDEVEVEKISKLNEKFTELEKRKESILNSIEEQGQLTDELKQKIKSTYDSNELEDLYLPYKPKRKTRASIAREKGLEPLAKILMAQKDQDIDLRAESFLSDQVNDIEDALQGARDIIAEWVNENQVARKYIRNIFQREGVISSGVIKGKEEEGQKFKDYFDSAEILRKCPSHRLMAIRRGEQEGILRISVAPDEQKALESIEPLFIRGNNKCAEQVGIAVKDSYKRLLAPSVENEILSQAKEKADEEAIRVFVANLRQLLLAPPLGQKRILAIDPGFRTGCKVVCLDAQGNLLSNFTIFPHAPQKEVSQASKKIVSAVSAYKIEAISIGNGTASRETESFIKKLRFDREVRVYVVSENGASVYSASAIAREEFPEYDVTVRGAVSIGRRLMDPLAELVKIDPKSIGVGQYQHDVDQKKLKESLDNTVISCVSNVGVDLNTASKHLLTYISGLGPQLAQNIVDYRKENGAFSSREELKKVTRLGNKAFEQSAGFLRIRDAKNILDNTAVHPEQYEVVKKMAKAKNVSVEEFIQVKTYRDETDINKFVSETCGIPTLKDIMDELDKPGRDPRTIIKVFEFDKNIHKIEDLQTGMILPGIVTNITNFGAFVDVGVKQDGLVHISNLADQFVSDVSAHVVLHQHVKVKVLEVDASRKRIQFSMKKSDVGD